MDKTIDRFWNLRLAAVKEALERNHFEAYLAADAAEAKRLVLEEILPKSEAKSLSWGGSVTFVEAGLYDVLKKREDLEIIDTFPKKIPPEEFLERRRRALLVDCFLTGTNAITEDGILVNLDNWGNRVAGITFGPRHVIILAGRNKICSNLEEAMGRVKNIAAPLNAMRLERKTPCAHTGVCADCDSPERICAHWVLTEKSSPRKRIKVVLINQDLGL